MEETLAPRGDADSSPISIAIIELVGGDPLLRCIRCAVVEANKTQSEVLVICRASSNIGAAEFGYDRLSVVEKAGETVLERRLAAFQHSKSDVLVLIEDTTRPPEALIQELQHRFVNDAVGAVWGPVHISSALPASDRALGFLDYGRFASERLSRNTLPGNCLSIRKSHLEFTDHVAATEMMESKIATRLIDNGKQICFSEAMIAAYETRDRYNSSLKTRFHHGRFYAGVRYSQANALARVLGGLRAIAAPLILSKRGIQSVMRHSSKRRWPAEVLWILVMSMATAAGECAGAILGGGKSQKMWR